MNGPRLGMSAILPAPGAGDHTQKGQKMNLTKKMLAALIGLALALGFVTPAHAAKPRIVTQPVAGKYTEGQTITLRVKATGKKKKYQWQVRYAWEPRWQNIRPSWTKNGTAKKSTLKIRARLSDDRAKFRVKVTHQVKTKSGKTVKRTMTSKAVRVKVKAKKVTPRPTPSPTPTPTPTPEPTPRNCWTEEVGYEVWVIDQPYQPPVYETRYEYPLWASGHYPTQLEDGLWVAAQEYLDPDEWLSRPYDQYGLIDNSPFPFRPGTPLEEGRYVLNGFPTVEPGMLPQQHSTSRTPWWYYRDTQGTPTPYQYKIKDAVPEQGHWETHYRTEEHCND